MGKLLEIRWHGRAGQGAKTAALVLCEAAIAAGKCAQAFPEYGPQRMGAPMQAFNRISDEPITVHCHVHSPQIVIILDPTLISAVNVKAGVPDDGIYIVNTPMTPAEMRNKLGLAGGKVYTIDATQIAIDTLGRNIPNTPMMGAFVGATKLLDFGQVISDTKHKLEKKFRQEIVEKNVTAMQRAYQEVAGE